MTIIEFETIKQEFDNGNINIQNALLDAFLYDNKWYPVRSFVNQIHVGANNHDSIKRMVLLIPFIRIKEDVDFNHCNNFPISLTKEERLIESRLVLQRLNDLLK